jgi:tartrate dehydrogenase/decarboxylase / D-malate dehydrogenase
VKTYNIAVIPGDGVGPEVIDAGLRVLHTIADAQSDFGWKFDSFPWGAGHYLAHGSVMPEEALQQLRDYDAILLGAVGDPRVPDHLPAAQSVITIRQRFDQWVNLRPIKLLPGVPGPLKAKGPGDIDFVVVRENTEGEYVNAGGRTHRDMPNEVAVQTSIFTRSAVERVMRYAFDLAADSGRSLTSISKGNALAHSLVFWDQIFEEVAADYPQVKTYQLLADAAALFFVREPERFEVVVTTNMLGDILTDLGAGLQGGIGMAPSANINPERAYPSMFEPIHGAAPDIAGRGIANPIGTIWSIQMMLEFVGEQDWAKRVMNAIEETVAQESFRTGDLGGRAKTMEVAEAVCRCLR